MPKKPFRKNASVILRKNGKFLLVKKPRNHHAWQFPQGGVEASETFEEAARREFAEELGTRKIKILREAGVYSYEWAAEEKVSEELKKFRGQEVRLFLAEFLGKDADIELDQNELTEWRWVDAAELKELIESPEYLKKILEILNATD
ncbi:NUDIX domain-containing protein [Patescibacteria group bacterium]|nr:NUDIX domain-containing protein [Patescibacteria group bacterium]